MGLLVFLSRIIPLLVLLSDCDCRKSYRGEDGTVGGDIRIAPGPNCWFPNYYCSVTEENIIDKNLKFTGGPEACMDTCTGSCEFFTWFNRRGIEYCYKLSKCGPGYRVFDDWCLARGPSCSSGPRSCDLLQTNNTDCAQLISYPNRMEWQCEDGGPGHQVNGYDQSLKAGTRCLLSCDSWTSERWVRKSTLEYKNRDKGFLFSECTPNGTWSTVQPNDVTDGTQLLQWPSQPYPYPNPNETPPSCNCKHLTLVWPPSDNIDSALATTPFYYNPRDEKGATFECEAEIQNYDVLRTKMFEVNHNNTCRFLCDDFLVATIICEDGQWTGGTEKGFWCYEFPKHENRLKDYSSIHSVDTRIIIEENGETFEQKNTYNSETGTLAMNVPQHGNLLESTTILDENPDTNLLETNNTCQLSTLPVHLNLTKMAANLGEIGTADNQTIKVYYVLNARESIVGVEERKTLLQQVQSQCSDLPMAKTRTIHVPKEDFKSGDLILVNKTSNARHCSIEWEVCSNEGPHACGYGWTNPDPNAPVAGFTFHQVSSGAICVNCVIETAIPNTSGCNVAPFDQYCACANITSKEILMDCRLQGAVISVAIQEGSGTFNQTTSYSNDYDRRAVSFATPAHGSFVEMEVIMNARADGYWHSFNLKNNRMMKIGSTCYIDTLHADHFPIDMAIGMQEIAAGNTVIKPEDEDTVYIMLVNEGPIDMVPLHELVKDSCQNLINVKSRQEFITSEESDMLANGGVIFRNPSKPESEKCLLKTAYTNLSPRSCWRWPNPETGVQIAIHSIISPVESLSCYINNDPSCPEDYCLCSDITDTQSFLDCEPKVLFVATGIRGPDERSANMSVHDVGGNMLYSADDSYTKLIPSSNSIGAVFRGTSAMDETIFLCAGKIEQSPQPPSQCYMYVKGAGFSPSFALEGNFDSPGSSVVFTTEAGDYWWIIGENSAGVNTSLYFNLQPYTDGDYPPVLPKALNNPCITKVNNTFAFVTGAPFDGSSVVNKAWLYDFGNNLWSSLPDTRKKREGASCGVLDTSMGPIIFLAGGVEEATTEYMVINDAVWTEGPTMLEANYGGRMVNIKKELILIGGWQVEDNMQGFKPTIGNNVMSGFSHRTNLTNIDPPIFNTVALTVRRRLFNDLLTPPTTPGDYCGPEACGLICTPSQGCKPSKGRDCEGDCCDWGCF